MQEYYAAKAQFGTTKGSLAFSRLLLHVLCSSGANLRPFAYVYDCQSSEKAVPGNQREEGVGRGAGKKNLFVSPSATIYARTILVPWHRPEEVRRQSSFASACITLAREVAHPHRVTETQKATWQALFAAASSLKDRLPRAALSLGRCTKMLTDAGGGQGGADCEKQRPALSRFAAAHLLLLSVSDMLLLHTKYDLVAGGSKMPPKSGGKRSSVWC